MEGTECRLTFRLLHSVRHNCVPSFCMYSTPMKTMFWTEIVLSVTAVIPSESWFSSRLFRLESESGFCQIVSFFSKAFSCKCCWFTVPKFITKVGNLRRVQYSTARACGNAENEEGEAFWREHYTDQAKMSSWRGGSSCSVSSRAFWA